MTTISIVGLSCLASVSNAQAPATTPAPAAPAPTMAPAGMAAPGPMTTPGMTGPLTANPNPTQIDAGPLGKVYITGVVSGLGMWQDNHVTGDQESLGDLSNGQVFINKTTGTLQYFIQGGGYSLPDLGTPYLRSDTATGKFYGTLPQAFFKYVPNSTFSFEAGKLPTLIGAEYTWSFENMNVERGLLWNQENAVNRGFQANYTKGPITAAVSWNDGMYSNIVSWIWLSVADTINKNNTVSVIAGGNTKHTSVSSLVTPLYLNNEQLYNVIYTHLAGPWTIEPYVQYTYVPKIVSIGALSSASTTGAALFLNYAFPATAKFGGLKLAGFNLPMRVEYITSTGSVANGAPNLIYGPGSNAWSATITPTYQYKTFFTRMEVSYVAAAKTTAGSALGATGNDKNQSRFMLETGVLF